MNAKLFQTFAGVVKQGFVVNGVGVPADTPCLVMGMYVPTSNTPHFVVMLQGGVIANVEIAGVRIELTDEMKKALAEVVLSS